MDSETAFTRLVGCRLPLQQAGMAGVGGPELAVAVADAGALGMLGTPLGTSAAFAAMLMDTVRRTSGVLGVNFLVPFLDRDAVSIASSTVRLVEFFYGEPDGSLVSLVHDAGALAAWQIGSPNEAKAAVDVGCDLVVAQGVEAGGHVRSQVGLLPLLDAVIDAVEVPVVAAGGIGSARGVAAVLAAGADAARIGTRFLATVEANIHPQYQQALIEAGVEDTVLTTTFSVGWPGAPHRVLRSCVEAVASSTDENVGEVRTPDGASSAIPLRSPLPPTRETTGSIAVMAHYAGQSVGGIGQILRAADVVEELAAGTRAVGRPSDALPQRQRR